MYVRKCCDCEKIDLGILKDLHVLNPLNKKKWFMYAVCMYVCIDVPLASARIVGRNFSHIRNSSVYLS
jgi:hypothetical protein